MAVRYDCVYGIHAVSALIKHHAPVIKELHVQQNSNNKRIHAIKEQALAQGVALHASSIEEIESLLPSAAVHQGVVALYQLFAYTEKDLPQLLESADNPLLLILDQVQDPHNLGACMRSANAFGATAVIAPKDRSATLTPVALKVACGAAATTPFITVTNLTRCLQQLKNLGVWLVGTSDKYHQALTDIDLTGAIAIILGGEGPGMRKLTAEQCDFQARLELQGNVSSINVSVAAGICLYEADRQRTAKKN